MKEYEKTFEEFWLDKVTTKGVLDLDKVKRELHDFKHLIDNVPKVYGHVTGSMLSKPMYDAETVIGAFEEHLQEEMDFWYDEGFNEGWDEGYEQARYEFKD